MTDRGNKKAEKEAMQRFTACIKKERTHLRVGDRRNDGTSIALIGTVGELHGPSGVCTCCHGRSTP